MNETQTFFDEVTKEWLKQRMQKFNKSVTVLSNDLGVKREVLGMSIYGKRDLTKPQKSMFYYYFLALELQEKLKQYENQ